MIKEKKNSLFYVKIFLVVFTVVFLIAVGFKIYTAYANRQFTENVFNILIISDEYVGVIGVDDSDKRLNSAVIIENISSIKKRNQVIQSINFGIPIHAYVAFPEGVVVSDPTKSFFSADNIKSISTNLNIIKKNITFFDWIRLFQVSNQIDDNRINVKTYATITDLSQLLSQEDETFFRNSEISNRKTSMQVINATNINGLGNRVGDMFSRFGYNVVSVSTNDADKSVVYYGDDAFYEDALIAAKGFGFPVEKLNDYVIAEVTVVIGEESELLLEDLAY